MNTQTILGAVGMAALYVLSSLIASGEPPPDLTSGFDADAEAWTASDPGATLTWNETGGVDGAYLDGAGTGTEWHFVSPPSWSGDWSGYQVLKFDMGIPSRHYADEDRGDMVVIEGGNGATMTWNGPTPLWTWTHFEVSLDAASFGVSEAIFDGIMADVAELRILAELTTDTETVGLDNVVLTATPIQVHSADLIERFTHAVVDPDDGTVAGWMPVDDVTFYVDDSGRPSKSLHGNDWRDGRIFRIASPPEWSGDWSGFTELSFDLLWDSTGEPDAAPDMVQVRGANGVDLIWAATPVDNTWIHHSIPLEPASFGVDQATFDGVMAHVNQIWIRGEYNSGDDQAYLDNVMLTTAPRPTVVHNTSLVSRFGVDSEGWVPLNNCDMQWVDGAGRSGGCITGQDTGSGVATLQSPDSWSGDWSAFSHLRFFLRAMGRNLATLDPTVRIVTRDGSELMATIPRPYRSWTPFTLDLAPETFGVDQATFDAIISNVAHLWIRVDLVDGTGTGDTTGLDDVSLITDDVGGAPPDRLSEFVTDAEGWRGNGWDGVWNFATSEAEFIVGGGNPDGCIALDDAESTAFWLSPEAWAGDWRGYESVGFDLTIIQGTNLLEPGWMLSIVSTHGNLDQDTAALPALQGWTHYEFALTPEAFGVTQAEFDLKMRDVIALAIRSEWIYGSEKEALDNVRVTASLDAYRQWLGGYLTPAQMDDLLVSGETVDLDGDGATNWEEHVALTDPTDAASRFVSPARAGSSGEFVIEWQSRNGRNYRVWKTTTPEDAMSWGPAGGVVVGDDSVMTHMEAFGGSTMFFRVEVALP